MQQVFFSENIDNYAKKLPEIMGGYFSEGSAIAIKLHMGEPGNKNAFTPAYLKKIVDSLKQMGLDCFLFDTPVVYSSTRNSPDGYVKAAAKKGFTKEFLGCDVVVSNESIPVTVGKFTFDVSKTLAEADGVFVLSHVKGHVCSGFGGAVKNLGMGCVSKESKAFQHNGGMPVLTGECISCGICQEKCPGKCIKLSCGWSFNPDYCFGCSICIVCCPHNALKPKTALFDDALASAASAAASVFKKAFYMNVLNNISKRCDCDRTGGEIISPDMGALSGYDPVAIDTASVDIVRKPNIRSLKNEYRSEDDRTGGENIFLIKNNKDPYLHLMYAQSYGLGTMKYLMKHLDF